MALTKIRGAGAEGLTLSSTALTVANGLNLTDGNITVADGHGIDFSATSDGSGSMSSELFHNYEEGTWTPDYKGETSSGSYTFVEQQGFYIRVGRYVTAWWNLTNITDVSEGSGRVVIDGLPYQVSHPSGFNGEGIGTAQVSGFTGITGSYINVQAQESTHRIVILKMTGTNNDTSPVNVTTRAGDGSDLRGCIHYRAS